MYKKPHFSFNIYPFTGSVVPSNNLLLFYHYLTSKNLGVEKITNVKSTEQVEIPKLPITIFFSSVTAIDQPQSHQFFDII